MKMSKVVKEKRQQKQLGSTTNYMGGTSFKVDPLTTLKMVTTSSIFGEPQYYRHGEFQQRNARDGRYYLHSLVEKDFVLLDESYKGMKTSEVMEKVIDEALSFDFEETLKWAAELRTSFWMRLNPQIIMVRAAMHPERASFTEKNPGKFNEINQRVMRRADEPSAQATYWLYNKGSKKGLPSLLKRSWKDRLEKSTAYEIAKYKNTNIGMIDTVRISHANSKLINELMSQGNVEIEDEDMTWNRLRSEGKSWREILATTKLPHMALLRNLRGIFEEIDDINLCKELLEELKAGVSKGKQFPFRYFSAFKAVEAEMGGPRSYLNGMKISGNINHGRMILDALEECIDLAREHLPKLEGKTISLSDNSGSAWGTFNSEYGKMTVAEINNLSAIMTAQNADEGYVGIFGDNLEVYDISKREGALKKSAELTKRRDSIGFSTENGVWLFLDNAIKNKEHWDNIFIYSDMQAGHGGLYGKDVRQYSDYVYKDYYIDVLKLVKEYRSKVNPKVNVFTVQTAGYDNVVIPQNIYRGAVLYGWTGRETQYASEMIKLWNEVDEKKKQA
ncbi:hypothetical protein AAGG74_15160 [Bacillus mexicanus]|uniref:hypothetical protein n=1 Tax=Bacillus mexicanus TaxID=2834415 RepID=UPI003D1FA753